MGKKYIFNSVICRTKYTLLTAINDLIKTLYSFIMIRELDINKT